MLLWATTGRLYGGLAEHRYTEEIREICVEHDIPLGESEPDTNDYWEQETERYCITPSEPTYTLQEISDSDGFDVGRERVRQIEASALRKMRANRLVMELYDGEPRMSSSSFEHPDIFSEGCRCRRWDSAMPGVIYCRLCGNTWTLPEEQIRKLLTRTMLNNVEISED